MQVEHKKVRAGLRENTQLITHLMKLGIGTMNHEDSIKIN